MSPRWIRRIVLAVFVGGIGGMIGTSIADNVGGAITFGMITAVAAMGLILVTSVAGPAAFAPARPDEDAALALEEAVAELVQTGADEALVRRVVRAAVRMERSRRP